MVCIAWSYLYLVLRSLAAGQSGINPFGVWIASLTCRPLRVLARFVYGSLERLLLPFGLHCVTIPMNYTSLETYTIATWIRRLDRIHSGWHG